MTLVIYFPCKDGCVLISDRLETHNTGAGSPDDKILLSKDCKFAIGGVGASRLIKRLFGEIYSDSSVNSTNITEKFEEKIRSLPADDLKFISTPESSEFQDAEFIMVIWQTERVRVEYVSISRGKHFSHNINHAYHQVKGEGEELANYILRNRAYQNYSLNEAIAYCIAVMQEVADNHRGVGKLEEFGFSIVAFSKDRTALYCTDYRTPSPRIILSFQSGRFDMTEFTAKRLESEDA